MNDIEAVVSNGIQTVAVFTDEMDWCDDPRIVQEHLGTMACWYRNPLGDELDKPYKNSPRRFLAHLISDVQPDYDVEELLATKNTKELLDAFVEETPHKISATKPAHYIALPVSVYEHGGITITANHKSVFPDSHWDASTVGIIYTPIVKAFKELGLNGIPFHPTSDQVHLIEETLRNEVDVYNDFLNGNYHQYISYQGNKEMDHLGGYLGELTNDLLKEIVQEGSTIRFDSPETYIARHMYGKQWNVDEFLLSTYPNLYEQIEIKKEILVKELQPKYSISKMQSWMDGLQQQTANHNNASRKSNRNPTLEKE